ncbi:MAG: hypothetical protein AAF414_20405 [Pseudomonadota bacterium]
MVGIGRYFLVAIAAFALNFAYASGQQSGFLTMFQLDEYFGDGTVSCIDPTAPGVCDTVVIRRYDDMGRLTLRSFVMPLELLRSAIDEPIVWVIDISPRNYARDSVIWCVENGVNSGDFQARFYQSSDGSVVYDESLYREVPGWVKHQIYLRLRNLGLGCSRFALADEQFDEAPMLYEFSADIPSLRTATHVVYFDQSRTLRLGPSEN